MVKEQYSLSLIKGGSCCVINIDPSPSLSSKTVGGANLSIGRDTSDVEPVLEINSIVNSRTEASKYELF